jgi:hypothetical protein
MFYNIKSQLFSNTLDQQALVVAQVIKRINQIESICYSGLILLK